ncbi:glycosyltransferase family 39 protein [bacterium]|nr:glycosyltransferase family 39 protein [bacterium]
MRWSLVFTAAFLGIYLAAVVPSVFFRHDDWWILGNAVRYIPTEPGFLWSSELYHDGKPLVWFFRPGFKLGTYLFFQLFGFQYAAWIAIGVLATACALLLGYACVRRVASPTAGFWFVAAASGSWLAHFGSVAWMGEGMMNIPQLLLLLSCTWAFLKAADNRWWILPSIAALVLALGFKESSLFHLLLLAGILVAEKPFEGWSWGQRARFFLPYAVLGAAYLVARLGWMPVNPSYLPHYTVARIARSFVMAVGPTVLAMGLWWGMGGPAARAWTAWKRRLAYLPFLAASLSVYLGHGFFSPGWYLVLTWSLLLVFAFGGVPAGLPARRVARFGVALTVLSVGFLLWRLDRVGWWHWKTAQTEFFETLRRAPSDLENITVRNCYSAAYPNLPFERVVANAEGVRQIWYLLHGRAIQADVGPCTLAVNASPSHLVIDWGLR